MRDFQTPGRSLVYATNGMCATSHPLAAQVAVRLLQDGGNAVDAAIAAAVLLGFCEPPMCGLGGDAFVLLKPPGERAAGRAERLGPGAGRRSTPRRCAPPGTAAIPTARGGGGDGARARSTPSPGWPPTGAGSGSPRASRRRSRYAEAGVPVAPRTARDWAAVGAAPRRRRAALLPLRRRAAARPARLFRAPGQAEVLRRIARDGRDGFYEGEVAEDMVASLRALGGAHTLEDFAATACDYVEPIAGDYRGHELVELPPNGQGATAILMARILGALRPRRASIRSAPRAPISRPRRRKLAYDARNRFVADPAQRRRGSTTCSPTRPPRGWRR